MNTKRSVGLNKENKKSKINQILIDVEEIFTKTFKENEDPVVKNIIYELKKNVLSEIEKHLTNPKNNKPYEIIKGQRVQCIFKKNNRENELTKKIEQLQEKIKNMEKEYCNKENQIVSQKDKELKLKQIEINKLKEDNKNFSENIIKIKEELSKKNNDLDSVDNLKIKISFLDSLVKEKENDLNNCMEKFQEIENIIKLVKKDDTNKNGYKIEEEEKSENILGLVGIKNEELNCYMSSILQILKNISCFSLKFMKIQSDDKIISSFQKLIYNLCYSKEKYISLLDFKNKFSSEYGRFAGRQSNDSTFFLIYLFQYLHKNLNLPNKAITSINEFSKIKLNTRQLEELEKFLNKYEIKNKSFIHDLFYGYQMNNMICSGCYFAHISFQSFNILDIPLMESTNRLNSLEECLNCYLITKDQKDIKGFECTKCKRKLLSHQTSIIKLPPILIINLKRVGERVVYYHDIDIPLILHTKDMQKLDYFKKQYVLIGFIKHFGNDKDGHNIAYCINMFNKKWYSFNDTQVSELRENPNTSKAFLLFYQLKDYKEK